MCLYIKPYTRRRIAGRDIPVFKVLHRAGIGLWSPYQGARYKQGQTKRVKLEKELEYRRINIGLHAFVDKECAETFARIRGFRTQRIVLVDMTVPKGSAYYLGNNGDIVSSRLKFTGRSE